MVEWLAGNRIIGTSTERTSTAGFNPVTAVAGGWKELGRDVVVGTASEVFVSSLPDKQYYMVMYEDKGQASAQARFIRYNSDSGSNYSNRVSSNGAADTTSTSQPQHNGWNDNNTLPQFNVWYIANLAGKEKLLLSHGIYQGTAGAGTSPNRNEYVGKWANTADSINRIGVIQNAGVHSAGTTMTVLGWDPADTHTDNFWEELVNMDYQGGGALVVSTPTFASKKYLWVQVFVKQASPYACGMTFNGDTTRGSTNYAFRYSANGGADPTPHVNTWSTIKNYSSLAGGGYFFNAFILNNATNEKLVIGNTAELQTTGAGTAPNRMESVAKWNDATNSITKINVIGENGSGNISDGTQIRVWGSN